MIKIEYNDRTVLDALNELSRRMDDLTPVMRAIAGVMADATARAFENEEDPASGLAWHPLMASTVKMRGGDAHSPAQRPACGGIVTAASDDADAALELRQGLIQPTAKPSLARKAELA